MAVQRWKVSNRSPSGVKEGGKTPTETLAKEDGLGGRANHRAFKRRESFRRGEVAGFIRGEGGAKKEHR